MNISSIFQISHYLRCNTFCIVERGIAVLSRPKLAASCHVSIFISIFAAASSWGGAVRWVLLSHLLLSHLLSPCRGECTETLRNRIRELETECKKLTLDIKLKEDQIRELEIKVQVMPELQGLGAACRESSQPSQIPGSASEQGLPWECSSCTSCPRLGRVRAGAGPELHPQHSMSSIHSIPWLHPHPSMAPELHPKHSMSSIHTPGSRAPSTPFKWGFFSPKPTGLCGLRVESPQ